MFNLTIRPGFEFFKRMNRKYHNITLILKSIKKQKDKFVRDTISFQFLQIYCSISMNDKKRIF